MTTNEDKIFDAVTEAIRKIDKTVLTYGGDYQKIDTRMLVLSPGAILTIDGEEFRVEFTVKKIGG